MYFLNNPGFETVPECIDGDRFQISVLSKSNGTAIVSKGEIVWDNDKSPIIAFSDIQKSNGVGCA